MKTKVFPPIFFVLVFLIHFSKAQTLWTDSVIENSVVWTQENSPYQLVTDMEIKPGGSLTIQEGVEVEVHGLRTILVNGGLEILGAASDSVRFYPADTTQYWFGISIGENANDSINMKFAYFKKAFSILWFNEHSSIRPYTFDLEDVFLDSVYYSIYSQDSLLADFYLDRVHFRGCYFGFYAIQLDGNVYINEMVNEGSRYGISIQGIDSASSYLELRNSRLENIGSSSLIFFNGRIENNSFINSSFYAGYGRAQWIQNEFIGGEEGLFLALDSNTHGDFQFKYNTLCGFEEYAVFIYLSPFDVDLSENCWCSENLADIDSMVIDEEDYWNAPQAILEPFYGNCDNLSLSQSAIEHKILYPNPVRSGTWLTMSMGNTKRIQIHGLDGRLVHEISDLNSSGFEIPNVAPGLYIITGFGSVSSWSERLFIY